MKTLIMSYSMRLLLIAFAIVIFVLAAGWIRSAIKDRLVPPASTLGSPYLHKGDGEVASSFHPGEVFYVRAVTRRVVPCFGEIMYAILQTHELPDGDKYRKFWYVYPVSAGASGIGTFVTDELKAIPEWLPPGDYAFARSALYTCDGLSIPIQSPMIPFNVSGDPKHTYDALK